MCASRVNSTRELTTLLVRAIVAQTLLDATIELRAINVIVRAWTFSAQLDLKGARDLVRCRCSWGDVDLSEAACIQSLLFAYIGQ